MQVVPAGGCFPLDGIQNRQARKVVATFQTARWQITPLVTLTMCPTSESLASCPLRLAGDFQPSSLGRARLWILQKPRARRLDRATAAHNSGTELRPPERLQLAGELDGVI